MSNFRIILQNFPLRGKSIKQLHELVKHQENGKKIKDSKPHEAGSPEKKGKSES